MTKGAGRKLWKLVTTKFEPCTVDVQEVMPGSGEIKKGVKPSATGVLSEAAGGKNPRVTRFFKQYIIRFDHPEKGPFYLTTGGVMKPGHHNREPKSFDTAAEAERELPRVLAWIRRSKPSWLDEGVLSEAKEATREQLKALRVLADVGKTWVITMSDSHMKNALALKKLGLIQFAARGGGRGSDAVVTDAGRRALATPEAKRLAPPRRVRESALAEREAFDQRANEQYAEIIISNLRALRRALAKTKLTPAQAKAVKLAIAATEGALGGFLRRTGLRARDMDVEPTTVVPEGRHTIRKHLAALTGHLARQTGARQVTGFLVAADKALIVGPRAHARPRA